MNINATVFVQILTFAGFSVLCRIYVWPPILAVIELRQKEQADGLSKARQGEDKEETGRNQGENKEGPETHKTVFKGFKTTQMHSQKLPEASSRSYLVWRTSWCL